MRRSDRCFFAARDNDDFCHFFSRVPAASRRDDLHYKKCLLCSVLTGLSIIFTAPLVRAQDPLSRSTHEAQEPHLQNVKQLTFGGQNAEAYFSYDGSKIIFQSTRPPYQCDQIFSMNVDGSDVKLLNSGKGRTTCGFFFPDGKRIIYASTHLAGDACPPAPDRSQGYVWPIYPSYEIFSANLDGSGLKRLTKTPGYDAREPLRRMERKSCSLRCAPAISTFTR